MLSKRIFWTLLMAGMIIISTTVTQAQSTDRKTWPEAVETTPQEAQAIVQGAQGGILDVVERQKTAIVGAWLATGSDGSKALLTFNSDGTLQGTVQGAVSPTSPLGVLSDGQGVWQHLGGRQFGKTLWGLRYDINTGQLNGFVKVRTVLMLNEAGDQMTDTSKLELLSPDGKVVFTAMTTGTFTRIKFEPLN